MSLQEFPVSLLETKLRSGKVMTQRRKREEIIEEDTLNTLEVETTPEPAEQIILKSQEPSSSHIVQPPFPKRLEMKIKQREFDLVSELRNVCIKIPLL